MKTVCHERAIRHMAAEKGLDTVAAL